jgi:hypothetical protein
MAKEFTLDDSIPSSQVGKSVEITESKPVSKPVFDSALAVKEFASPILKDMWDRYLEIGRAGAEAPRTKAGSENAAAKKEVVIATNLFSFKYKLGEAGVWGKAETLILSILSSIPLGLGHAFLKKIPTMGSKLPTSHSARWAEITVEILEKIDEAIASDAKFSSVILNKIIKAHTELPDIGEPVYFRDENEGQDVRAIVEDIEGDVITLLVEKNQTRRQFNRGEVLPKQVKRPKVGNFCTGDGIPSAIVEKKEGSKAIIRVLPHGRRMEVEAYKLDPMSPKEAGAGESLLDLLEKQEQESEGGIVQNNIVPFDYFSSLTSEEKVAYFRELHTEEKVALFAQLEEIFQGSVMESLNVESFAQSEEWEEVQGENPETLESSKEIENEAAQLSDEFVPEIKNEAFQGFLSSFEITDEEQPKEQAESVFVKPTANVNTPSLDVLTKILPIESRDEENNYLVVHDGATVRLSPTDVIVVPMLVSPSESNRYNEFLNVKSRDEAAKLREMNEALGLFIRDNIFDKETRKELTVRFRSDETGEAKKEVKPIEQVKKKESPSTIPTKKFKKKDFVVVKKESSLYETYSFLEIDVIKGTVDYYNTNNSVFVDFCEGIPRMSINENELEMEF